MYKCFYKPFFKAKIWRFLVFHTWSEQYYENVIKNDKELIYFLNLRYPSFFFFDKSNQLNYLLIITIKTLK